MNLFFEVCSRMREGIDGIIVFILLSGLAWFYGGIRHDVWKIFRVFELFVASP